MPVIVSLAEVIPPFEIDQEKATSFARELFANTYKDVERLLQVFQNGQIERRYFVKNIDWFCENHSFAEKNHAYIEAAVQLGKVAVVKCLNNHLFLNETIPFEEIDAIFFISSTGMATPSIEARIMNQLPFGRHTKRVPIWGLGCAGGAAGLSRAFDYCLAYPKAKVLVLAVELCGLTFQRNDLSKSNLIRTSLFADGIACVLVAGEEADMKKYIKIPVLPSIIATRSTLMPDSLDVMGWELKDEGLFVVFSRHIPHIIETWLKPNVTEFLLNHDLTMEQIDYFIAHPGGKKVLDAYESSLGIPQDMTAISREVLKQFGNTSSSAVLYVLKRHLEMEISKGSYGLCCALGPGFSSELLLMRWD